MKYDYPRWIYFLLRHFNYLFEFNICNEKLDLKFGESKFSLALEGLPRQLKLIEKAFWTDVELCTNSKVLVFKVLNKHKPQCLGDTYSNFVTDIYRRKAQKKIPEMLKLYEEIKAFLLPNGYIRTSAFQRFMMDKDRLDLHWLYEFSSEEEIIRLEKLEKFFKEPFNSFVKANDRFVEVESKRYDKVLSSLNDSQRRACIINDDTNLVLAGAGTGKTKTLEVRTDYLIQSGRYKPEEILLVAFGRKARKELINRVGKPNNVNAVTFHGLGLSIVNADCEHTVVPDVLAGDEKKMLKFVDDEINRLLKDDSKFVELVINYFDDFLFPYKNPFEFKSLGEYYEYLKTNEIRAFSTDAVKSFEEVIIANFLYRNNIHFEYEKSYKGQISHVGFTSYKPDFYLPDYDIYIEHFGVNEKLEAPEYMDPEKYKAGIIAKRRVHEFNESDLIETYSYMQRKGNLLTSLKKELAKRNVKFDPIPKDEYLDDLKKLGAITKLADLTTKAIGLMRTMNHDVNSLRTSLMDSGNRSLLAAIDVLEPLLMCFEKHLEKNSTVDFNSMINDAIKIIKKPDFVSPYKVIMVDEYQDISGPRAGILKALQERDPELVIYGVGDDRQAIFRFTGSDLSLTYNFFDEFGEGKRESLDETYRFNDKINKVATKFISENKRQSSTDFIAKQVDDARVHIVRTTEKEQQDKLNDVINWILNNHGSCSILLLNRYGYKKPKYFDELRRTYKNKNIEIEFATCHSSKGREADFVVLMGMEKGPNGFPAEKIEHPLIEFLLPDLEAFEYAEERRLFYVALTRAKQRVFILSNEQFCSDFVKEIRKYGKQLIDESTIEPSLLALNVTKQLCPKCETGRVIKRGDGSFSTCSNQPFCDYLINNCKSCGGERNKVRDVYICKDRNCNTITPACPKCDGDLRPTTGANGRYWGCYKGWKYCKGSQDWSIYEDNPNVYIDIKSKQNLRELKINEQ